MFENYKKRLTGIVLASVFLFGLTTLDVSAEPAEEPAPETVTAQIPLQVRITGDAIPDEKVEFKIRIEPEEEEFPMPDRDEFTVAGGGTDVLIEIPFTRVGIYTYSLEMSRDVPGDYSFDSTKFRARIMISRENGQLQSAVSVYKEGDTAKQDGVLFTSTYEGKPGDSAVNGVETGDRSGDMLWWNVFLCGAGALCAVMILISKTRKSEEDQKEEIIK